MKEDMNRDAYRELRKNTIIIAVANLGSKAISFIMAPLYSFFLSTSQYGTMDLIVTTIGLSSPLFCLDVYEATFRYSNDKDYDDKRVLSTSLLVCLPGILIAFIVMCFALVFSFHVEYIGFTLAYIVLSSIINILSQYARGRKDIEIFARSGVVNSLALLASNLLFLVLLNLELRGWLISFLLSQLLSATYLCVRCDVLHQFSLRFFDKEYLKVFLNFCAPLIPTAAMWWIMNASDRYMITYFLDSSSNGIYSAANKLPIILSLFENVFYMAWQTTAISTMNDMARDTIYSNVFNLYLCFLSMGVILLLIVGKPMIYVLFASDYSRAWICLAPLFLGVLIHALAGNLGSLYSVFKNTKGALYSTIAGALTNIILNLVFIPRFGILGAAITTIIGYIVTLVYRWFDVKRFVEIKMELPDTIVCLALLLVQLILYYDNSAPSYIIRILIFLVILIRNKNSVLRLVKR